MRGHPRTRGIATKRRAGRTITPEPCATCAGDPFPAYADIPAGVKIRLWRWKCPGCGKVSAWSAMGPYDALARWDQEQRQLLGVMVSEAV